MAIGPCEVSVPVDSEVGSAVTAAVDSEVGFALAWAGVTTGDDASGNVHAGVFATTVHPLRTIIDATIAPHRLGNRRCAAIARSLVCAAERASDDCQMLGFHVQRRPGRVAQSTGAKWPECGPVQDRRE